ncbi:hypothetical protein, partial [Tsukamurella pulmonis]|uniref:hypothetical protein n=1 Tax=Tsukamurella pulmonis TaxID=47312 RepID=UPI001A9FF1AE
AIQRFAPVRGEAVPTPRGEQVAITVRHERERRGREFSEERCGEKIESRCAPSIDTDVSGSSRRTASADEAAVAVDG